jgi:hypothetical protein
MHGLRLFDSSKIKSLLNYQNEDILYDIEYFKNNVNSMWENLETYTHREALEIIKNRITGVEVQHVN